MRKKRVIMGSAVHFRRLFMLAALVGLAFALLGARLVSVQYYSHEKYLAIAERNREFTKTSQPRRGDILDRNRNPLAVSVPVKRVFADPSVLGEHREMVARVMAPLLEYDPAVLSELLAPTAWLDTNSGRMVTNQHVNLRRGVRTEHWSQIESNLAELRFHPEGLQLTRKQKEQYNVLRRFGIYGESDQQRFYPSGRLASHVLGFAQAELREFNGKWTSTIDGRSGVEAWFNEQLRGWEGWQQTETDVLRREVVPFRGQKVDARPGLSVVLTLDMVVQQIVEKELARAMIDHRPSGVSSVVIRPDTGEILALAGLPDFDPGDPGEAETQDRRNRVLSDQMEPGSTFKIVPIAAALNEGLVQLSDRFDCEQGQWLFQGRLLKDHHAYGVLSVEEIVMKSSNIGAAKIGLLLGEERLYRYVRSFGFGEKTGITLGAETRGTVHPTRAWDNLTISRIPMGHAIAVTHLQMVMAMGAIANGGRLMQPMLVQRLEDQDGAVFAEYHPREVRRVVSSRTASLMASALKRVVEKGGTAPQAALEHYTVFGKTGTANKPVPGGYSSTKYITSFIGAFPADKPELCISVVFDEPRGGHFGGSVAGPVFKRIAEQVAQYLKLRPDVDVGLMDAVTGL